MKMSQRGLDELIKPSEGYHAKQPDGSCKAYRCPAGVWTCGWGATEGITPNTHWSLIEAEAALRAELAAHEAAVDGMVKVPLTQGQRDALISLSYNIGSGAVAKSALLRHLNAGDYARAASHFSDFKYSRVTGSTAIRMKVPEGTKCVLPGLVTRRALETQFFLEADPVGDVMSQKIEPPRTKLDIKATLTKVVAPVAASSVAVVETLKSGIPAVPEIATKSVENVSAWKTFGKTFFDVGNEAIHIVTSAGRAWPYLLIAGIAGSALVFLQLQRGRVRHDKAG